MEKKKRTFWKIGTATFIVVALLLPFAALGQTPNNDIEISIKSEPRWFGFPFNPMVIIQITNNGLKNITANCSVESVQYIGNGWMKISAPNIIINPGETNNEIFGAGRFSTVNVTVQAGDTIVTQSGFSFWLKVFFTNPRS
jgi:hypothetical protein